MKKKNISFEKLPKRGEREFVSVHNPQLSAEDSLDSEVSVNTVRKVLWKNILKGRIVAKTQKISINQNTSEYNTEIVKKTTNIGCLTLFFSSELVNW